MLGSSLSLTLIDTNVVYVSSISRKIDNKRIKIFYLIWIVDWHTSFWNVNNRPSPF